MDTAMTETCMELSQRIENRATYDPVLPLLGINPTEMKFASRRRLQSMFIAASLTIVKKWKQSKCPSMDK
jgi:hypothetical protein